MHQESYLNPPGPAPEREWFRRAAEAYPDAIILLNASGHLMFANTAAERFFGRRRDEMEGRPFRVDRLDRQGDQVRVRHPDGTTRHGEIHTMDVTWGSESLTVISVRDTTALREAEDRLAKSERTLKSILDHMHVGTALLDRDYRVIKVNQQMVHWFGPADALVGKPCHRGYGQKGQDRVCEACPVQAMWADGNGHEAIAEWELDGKRRTFRIHASPVHDAEGQVVSAIEIVEDITETRQLEAQVRQATKMEAIGRLAGGIAHDLNNLLTVIGGHADFIESMLEASHPIRNDLDQIRAASARAASLTRQLLAFSRRQPMRPTVLELNAVLEDLHRMVSRIIGEDILLTFQLQPALWNVEADPTQIEQVVVNLVVNARDAMPTGGHLTIATANVTIDAENARPPMGTGRYVRLSVKDTGVGMDEETMSKIFEPFFTTKKETGTGLGLSTVYGIVKQNHGYVWVDSSPGKGSEFEVYFPAVDKAIERPSPTPAPRGTSSRSATILLVEDDRLVRRLVHRILSRAGYQVLVADGAKAARRVASDHDGPIDLLVTDVIMPETDGVTLAEQLKPTKPEMGVLYTSGYAEDILSHRGALSADTTLLEKPFDRDDLLRAVETALERKEQRF